MTPKESENKDTDKPIKEMYPAVCAFCCIEALVDFEPKGPLPGCRGWCAHRSYVKADVRTVYR